MKLVGRYRFMTFHHINGMSKIYIQRAPQDVCLYYKHHLKRETLALSRFIPLACGIHSICTNERLVWLHSCQ